MPKSPIRKKKSIKMSSILGLDEVIETCKKNVNKDWLKAQLLIVSEWTREIEDIDQESILENTGEYRMSIYYFFINNLLQFLNLNSTYSISILQEYETVWNREINDLDDESEKNMSIKKYLTFNSSLNLWLHTINNIVLLYSTIKNLLPCASFKNMQSNIKNDFSLYHGIRYKKSAFRDNIKNLSIGDKFTLPIFLSTSIDELFVQNWVLKSGNDNENFIIEIIIEKSKFNVLPNTYIGNSTIIGESVSGSASELVMNLYSQLQLINISTKINNYQYPNKNPLTYYTFKYLEQTDITNEQVKDDLLLKLNNNVKSLKQFGFGNE